MNLINFTSGRKKIFSPYQVITKENVMQTVQDGLQTHNINRNEINWLFNLYRGKDSIIENRTRNGHHSNVNNKAFVSYYSLIADYAANLFLQNPIVLVNVDANENIEEPLKEYIRMHRINSRYARDKTTALHAAICGVGYRFIEMDKRTIVRDSVISPTDVMVIYGDDTDDQAIAKVHITNIPEKGSVAGITGENSVAVMNLKKHYTVYTDDFIYDWTDGDKEPTEQKAMDWGCPIIEYKLNPFRIGAFERVTSLIQLLSILRSDGVNGVVQSIAGILLGKNIGIPMHAHTDDEETTKQKQFIIDQFAEQLKQFGQIWVDEGSKELPASVSYIATEMYNADIEVLYQGILGDIITITNTPNSVVNLGGSGNAGAARTASGTEKALENAKNGEPFWFESVREQTRVELDIAHYTNKMLGLESADLDFAMQRSILVDPFTTAQAYQMLTSAGVSIEDAATITGIDPDPNGFAERTIKNMEEVTERRLEFVKREQELTSRSDSTTTEVIEVEEGI